MSKYAIPNIKLDATGDQQIALTDFKGQNLVVYFYPKDNTPGCTTESKDFRDLHTEFKAQNTVILGVSRDSVLSHNKFCDKLDLPFDLLADTDETLCNHFGILGEKNMYGKKYLGIIRTTLLINSDGKLVKEWRKVKVNGHAQEVLKAVKELNAAKAS